MKSNLKNFKEYCEKYQNTFAPGTSFQEHSLLVERILKNPGLINLRGIQFRYKEVKLIGEENPGRIDLVFITNEEIPYICEVKASSKSGRGIEAQLERYYFWIRDKFELTPTRVGIQLTKTKGLKKRIIPARIEDIFQLNLNKEGGYNNETRIF